MLGLTLHGLLGITVRGESVLSWRLKRVPVKDLTRECYVPLWPSAVQDESQLLTDEIARLRSDKSPGVEALTELLLLRRRVFDVSSGVLALEVAWLVTVALIAPFIG
jgi:hypothetical protein